mmetsp:Transcript_7461/g.6745  ORF Transcript_7461/g.6745 Transcript_7461/m.6745 type:complete len:118 (-) Transcript_7461:186-539(-)
MEVEEPVTLFFLPDPSFNRQLVKDWRPDEVLRELLIASVQLLLLLSLHHSHLGAILFLLLQIFERLLVVVGSLLRAQHFSVSMVLLVLIRQQVGLGYSRYMRQVINIGYVTFLLISL